MNAARRRGWAQVVLVLVFSAVGVVALGSAVLGAYEPRPPVRIAGLLLHDVEIRALLAAVGLGLLATGAALWRFRRWSWYAAALVGGYALFRLVAGLVERESGAIVHLDLGALAVVACLPALWLRRRRFGVGAGGSSSRPESGG